MTDNKQHAARRLAEDHTADNPIDWLTLIESALLLALVCMVLWIVGGAR